MDHNIIKIIELLESDTTANNELAELLSDVIEQPNSFIYYWYSSLSLNKCIWVDDALAKKRLAEITKIDWYIDMNIPIKRNWFIPKNIDKFTNLVQLTISGANIQTIPESICKLKNLKYLDLDCNNITTVPKNIAMLNLERLDLRLNSLTLESIQILNNANIKYKFI